ncbi:glycosyl hydrolase family 95 catalytic domain-containing protein [Flagellimonas marina]|uniref:Glycoside hydrolase family 95-like protein n=1 Tax=Flagellimonas marina TaxID=1775168 RepID=A0ABV8PPT5_9FLAO
MRIIISIWVLLGFVLTGCAQKNKIEHLWDKEPSYWEAAQKTKVTLPVSKSVKNSSGNVIWTPQAFTERHDKGFQMNNKQLKVALWSDDNKQVLSLMKTDVWDRRFANTPILTLDEIKEALFDPNNTYNKEKTKGLDNGVSPRDGGWIKTPDGQLHMSYGWKAYDFPIQKPVGQAIFNLDDLKISEDALMGTLKCDDGTVSVEVKGKSGASAVFKYLTMMPENIVAVNVKAKGLTNPASLRLFRHQDITKANCKAVLREVDGRKTVVYEQFEGWDYAAHPEFGEAIEPPKTGHDDRFFWITQRMPAERTFPQGFEYVLMGLVTGSPYTIDIRKGKTADLGMMNEIYDNTPGYATEVTLPGKGETDFTLLLTVVTSNDGEDVLKIARESLRKAAAKNMDGLIAENADWYKDFYSKREQGRIFDGTAERAEKRIPNLFYSWVGMHSRESAPDPEMYEADAWYGPLDEDFTKSWHTLPCYNETYFTHYAVMNRLDMMDYQIKLPKFWLEATKRYAREVFGLEGAFGPPHGFQGPIKPDEVMRTNTVLDFCTEVPGQVLKCAWDAWDYGGNEEILTEYLYPPLREHAIFVSQYVTMGEDGKYHVIPSQSGEHFGFTYQYKYNKDNVAGVAMFKWILLKAAEAAEYLKQDLELAKQWRNVAAQMVDYHLVEGPSGSVFADAEGISSLGVPYNNATVAFPTAVADFINLDSDPKDKEIALNTARDVWGHRVNRQVFHLLGEDPDLLHIWWAGVFTYHMSKFGRKGWPPTIDEDITVPLDNPDTRWDAFFFEPERLINSRSGRIHLFPCVPINTTIGFNQMLARGGFEVSAEMIEGKTTYLKIHSRRDNVCQLMNPWPGQSVKIISDQSGKQVDFKLDKSNGECIVFKANKGISYSIKTN